MWCDTLPKNRFLRFWVLLAHRYLKHNVATQSAALAFYLLFMIFPFLIFISALLGLLNLNVAGIVSVLADFLPEVVLELTELYLTYVRENPSPWYSVWYFPCTSPCGPPTLLWAPCGQPIISGRPGEP